MTICHYLILFDIAAILSYTIFNNANYCMFYTVRSETVFAFQVSV